MKSYPNLIQKYNKIKKKKECKKIKKTRNIILTIINKFQVKSNQ